MDRITLQLANRVEFLDLIFGFARVPGDVRRIRRTRPGVFTGYFRDPEENAESFDEDG